MKTSLEHLPEQKQKEIQRIVEIIQEVMAPEMIILFGSYAKGKYVENRYRAKDGIEYEYISDYDILIVTRDEPVKPYLQESTIMDRVNRVRPPVNLEIHSIAYINDGLSWGQYFFTDIVNEGIRLFDSGRFHFATPRVLTNQEEKQKAQEYFDFWFTRSEEFFDFATIALEKKRLRIGAFHLHQATESLYYAVLLVFTGYKPRLHNIWKLRRKTKQYSENLFSVFQVDANKRDEHLFDLLKRGYIEPRYQKEYSINEEEFTELIEKVKTMMVQTKQLCTEKIASF